METCPRHPYSVVGALGCPQCHGEKLAEGEGAKGGKPRRSGVNCIRKRHRRDEGTADEALPADEEEPLTDGGIPVFPTTVQSRYWF